MNPFHHRPFALLIALSLIAVLVLSGCTPVPSLPDGGGSDGAAAQASTTTSITQATSTTEEAVTTTEEATTTSTTRPARAAITVRYEGDVDLSDFPSPFIDDGDDDVIFVVGAEAPVEDVITLSELRGTMQVMLGSAQFSTSSQLDEDIDALAGTNFIIIGDACTNTLVAQLYGNPWPCEDAFGHDYGVLKLFEVGDSTVLVIGGSSAQGRHDAAAALAAYDAYTGFSGDELLVDGSSVFTSSDDELSRVTTTSAPGTTTTTLSDMDLSSFPYPFLHDGEPQFIVVVGTTSPVSDIIASADLNGYLQSEIPGHPINTPTKLDNEISDLDAENLIVIGDACVNTVIAELLGNPEPCESAFPAGIGILRLIDTGAHVALIIGASDPTMRRTAVSALIGSDVPGPAGSEWWVNAEGVVQLPG